MKYIVSINDKNYEVEVERGEAQIVKTTKAIQIDTTPPPATVAAAAATVQASASPAQNVTAVDGDPIKAPLPGIVLAIKANTGASVKKGDVLMIIEAMKMENEILAPRDGVVAQVLAGKGSSVNTGELLLVLK